MEDTLAEYRANLRVEQAEIAAHSSATSGRKKWKTKDGVYQLKDPEKPEQAVPTTDDAMYADMLRDVRETIAGGTTTLRRTSERGFERG